MIYIVKLAVNIHMKIMKRLKKISRDDLKTVIGGKACSQWVGITALCGATYSLCTDNYKNWAELQEAVEYFNDAKC